MWCCVPSARRAVPRDLYRLHGCLDGIARAVLSVLSVYSSSPLRLYPESDQTFVFPKRIVTHVVFGVAVVTCGAFFWFTCACAGRIGVPRGTRGVVVAC